MKQEETLEEAIKREYETRKFNSDFPFDPQSFKLGAKWQQEQDLSMVQGYLSANLENIELLKRSYSEEEVMTMLYCFHYDLGNSNFDTKEEWFEQFKKK